MYRLNTYDARTATHRVLRFNSIDAAVRFIKEKLNQKEMQIYIARLRNSRELDKSEFGRRHLCLYTYYGDLDLPLPSVKAIEDDIKVDGKFEYRLGTSDPMFYEGFGCVYFKLEDECRSHTSANTAPATPPATPTLSSKPKGSWLTKPLFLSL